MVEPRLGTQSRRLPAPRPARDPSPDRWNGETRSQAHHLRGWGCSQALAHTSKDYFQKRVLTCGQRWLRGARLRTSNPAAGGAPGTASWCSTLGERRRSLRAESLRLRTSGALSQEHMRAAGSIPGGLWPSFPERQAADLATALARTPPGL